MATINEAFSKMKPVFRAREFIAALGGRNEYAYVALNRLKKKGKIESAKKGWWAKRGAAAEEIAAAISYPCYLSFHSALHAHGLTTQIPRFVQLAVLRKARKYRFANGEAREYKLKKSEFGGFEVKEGIPMATPEKAFADCLRLPRSCPAIILAEALGKVNIWEVKGNCNRRMLKRLSEVEHAYARGA